LEGESLTPVRQGLAVDIRHMSVYPAPMTGYDGPTTPPEKCWITGNYARGK